MPTFTDAEFGEITIRRSAQSRSVKLSIAPNGTVRVSAPKAMPLLLVKRVLKTHRQTVRKLLDEHHTEHVYDESIQIGKSHYLRFQTGAKTTVTSHQTTIVSHINTVNALAD